MSGEDENSPEEGELERLLEELRTGTGNGELKFADDDVISRYPEETDFLLKCVPCDNCYFISDGTRFYDFCMSDQDVIRIKTNLGLIFGWEDVDWMFETDFSELIAKIKQRLPNWPRPESVH